MAFKCTSRCSVADCCGIVPINRDVFKKHKNQIQRKILKQVEIGDTILPITDSMCCFLGVKTAICAIYPHRPIVCRLYGTLPELPCPYVDENGNERSLEEVKKTQMKITDMVDTQMLKLKLLKKRYRCEKEDKIIMTMPDKKESIC